MLIILTNKFWVTQHPFSFQNISCTNLHQFHFINLLNNTFYSTRYYNIELMHMQSIMLNIFKLVKNFIHIINNKYYMVVGAKYDSPIMIDVHTNYPADIVSLPGKVIWLTAFFPNSELIFVWLLCQPLAGWHGSQLMKCDWNITSRIFIISMHECIYQY